MFGAIEAGGTKFNCALGMGADDILAEARILTTRPEETLDAVVTFFNQAVRKYGNINALGLACFGPIDPDHRSPTYGHVLQTPKAHWSNTDILGILSTRLDTPTGFDTDVNSAALGELLRGAGQGLSSLVYMTIGTGIGGGVIANGRLVTGLIHPELGHMLVPKHPQDSGFSGYCTFHGACLEGLASGPAMKARWGRDPGQLDSRHIAWEIEADYLASLCINITATLSPQRIILGGGVMQQVFLLQKVRDVFRERFNNYLPIDSRAGGLENYIVSPGLGNRAGITGAFALAEAALKRVT